MSSTQLVQLYQHSTPELRQQTASLTSQLTEDAPPTQDRIDQMAQDLLQVLDGYHELATTIWDTKPPSRPPRARRSAAKPLTKSSLRRLTRLTRLRNACGTAIKEERSRQHPPTPRTGPHKPLREAILTEEIKHVFGDQSPTDPADIHAQCRKEIGTILRASKKRLETKLRDQENAFYDSNRKAYHKGLKVEAGLLPKAGTLPHLDSVNTRYGSTDDPAEVIDTVHAFFERELRKATPEEPGPPPWENENEPDPFQLRPHTLPRNDVASFTQLLQRQHYDRAVARLAAGKAPGPDGIPNEVIKHLPQQAHDAIFRLFTQMGALGYTPRAWCKSVTCLIYKPNKKDPKDPACYRPIALMNCILKLWTSIITYISSDITATEAIINDDAHGFQEQRQMYDALATHIHNYEDAKTHKKPIYTAYADFKGAFNAMDHARLFSFMRQMGLPECLISICKQLYEDSSTAYITPHGSTAQLPIRRGTLQGDTLSPHLFTLFIEPLMRWIKCGSRGYIPHCTQAMEGDYTITYDEHGYADDISITTGSLPNLKKQLRKLHLFSQYTGLDLEITKCEVTGALWDRGNPASKENIRTLRNQVATIDLTGKPGGPSLKFLPPNKSYKMLGVHINPMLDFSEHFQRVTSEVRKISAVLRRRKLSPYRKQMVIDQLLQAKYHAVHLGIFTEAQMAQIDSILATATRNAHQLAPGTPTECLYRHTRQYGLGCLPIRARAAKMGLAHLIRTINTPSDRGTIAFEHVKHLTALYGAWPEESFDTGRASLPTLRILRYIQDVPGLELQHINPLALTNAISDTLRAASQLVDTRRREQRDSLPQDIMDPKEYARLRRNTKPLAASYRILKHLSPLWPLKLTTWQHFLTRTAAGTIDILPTPAILTNVLGDAPVNTPTLTPAKKAIATLRFILTHPIDTEYDKLPSITTMTHTSPASVHPTWTHILPVGDLPLRRTSLRPTPGKVKKARRATHKFTDYLVPSDIEAPYDILEISDDDVQKGQQRYHVKWAPETLTRTLIDQHLSEGFEIETITPDDMGSRPGEEPTYTVQWVPSWQSEATVMGAPTGPAALEEYKCKKYPRRKARRRHPPTGTPRQMGWFPQHTTFRTTPINPDLDSYPTADFTFREHPTLPDTTVIHDPDGQAKGLIKTNRLEKLYNLYDPDASPEPFPSLILQQIITQGRSAAAIAENRLKHAPVEALEKPEDPSRHTWTIPDTLFDTLDYIFSFDRLLHCTPFNVPITAKCRLYSEDPAAAMFSMLPLQQNIWPGASLSLPYQTPQCLHRALEQAIYSAHYQRNHSPSCTVLILPRWTHSPYLARHTHSPYVHALMTIPAHRVRAKPTSLPTPAALHKDKEMTVYLVANSRALQALDLPTAATALEEAASDYYQTYIPVTTPSAQRPDGLEIASNTAYTLAGTEPAAPPPLTHTPLHIRPHFPLWNKAEFVYTDGSVITGQPTIGAGVVFPGVQEDRVIRIAVISDTERHTINRAELVAIIVALREAQDMPSIQILTDSLFCVHSLRNYIAGPSRYNDHLHRHLIEAATELIRARDEAGMHTHIGKVKSHTDVHYNDVADEAAKDIATQKEEPDMVFDEFDPPRGGLRTWPFIRTPAKEVGEPDRITHFTNLTAEPNKRFTDAAYTRVATTTLYGSLLSKARAEGADHTIHAYSDSGFRQRRDAMEVAWGSHKFRLMTKAHKRRFPTCTKCGHKLTHTHLLGGCYTTAKLKISRHHSTFKLLHTLLTQENGGRWPILAMDLGIKPTKNFEQQLEDCRADLLKPDPASPDEEEADEDKPDALYATILPEYLLPQSHRPRHYKPDIVRAVGYYIDTSTGKLVPDPTYEGRRVMQIIECKFATDTDMHQTVNKITETYSPLLQAIREYGYWRDAIEIIPIVISRTGSFHVKTLAEIAQLVSFEEEPPDEMTYKDLPKSAKRIAMSLHVHAQQWLTLMLKLSKQLLARRHPTNRTRRRK